MPFTLTMPKLSPTMEEGTITKWFKKEGDFVEAGELVIEVATDKASIEHSALDEGFLRKILVGENGEAIVNQPIAIFTEAKDESIEGYEPEGTMPTEEEVVEEVVEEGEAPKAAPKAAKGGAMAQPSFVPEPPLEDYRFEFPGESCGERLRASPLARKLAKEKGLDVASVKGSGPGGRVVAADLDKAQTSSLAAFGRREMPEVAPGTFEEQKLTPMRKIISQRLQETKTFVPHFYVTEDIDASRMVDLRGQLKTQDIKVTFNDFVVRACAIALRKHPIINSSFNTDTQAIVEYKTIDVSIAVSVDGGLITPIVRHADYKNLGQLSAEIKSLVKKARAQKLESHEYRGGSFTISNLGMYGIPEFHAIINPPQGAILAVGGINDVPVVKNGAVVPGKVMRMNLSVDHRVIDGAAAAEFLRTVKGLLESPAALLL